MQDETVDACSAHGLSDPRLRDANAAVGEHKPPVYDARLGVCRNVQIDVDRSVGRRESGATTSAETKA